MIEWVWYTDNNIVRRKIMKDEIQLNKNISSEGNNNQKKYIILKESNNYTIKPLKEITSFEEWQEIVVAGLREIYG
jgi:hypothetical protein